MQQAQPPNVTNTGRNQAGESAASATNVIEKVIARNHLFHQDGPSYPLILFFNSSISVISSSRELFVIR